MRSFLVHCYVLEVHSTQGRTGQMTPDHISCAEVGNGGGAFHAFLLVLRPAQVDLKTQAV